MKNKFLCMLLSVAMVFTSMTFPALASEQDKEVRTTLVENEESQEESSTNWESTATQEEASEEKVFEQETEENAESENIGVSESDEPETNIVENATESETAESETEETTDSEDEETVEKITEEVTEEVATDTKLQVAYHTVDEIIEFLGQSKAERTDSITYAAEPAPAAPYEAGVLSDTTLEAAAAMLNQIRFIAGLSYEVTLNDTYSQLSQAAALVNYANGSLDQEPSQPEGMSEDIYKQGYEGALKSNIAYTDKRSQSLNGTIVDTWMADSDNSNLSQLSHRRWMLNPSMEQVGFGAVKGSKGVYSAMYAADSSGSDENIFGIAWPAQNTPIDYFNEQYPWSVSTGEKLDAADIQVTLIRKSDGKKWKFSETSSDGDFYVDNSDYGQKGCIIFRPETSDITAYEDGDCFQVEITKSGKKYIGYNVNFFSMPQQEEKLTVPKASIATEEIVAKDTKLVLTSDEDAAIYYTVDGAVPTMDSQMFTEPITIESDITVKAIAVKEGYEDSEIAEFVYRVEEDVPLRYMVLFETDGGTTVPSQTVLENENAEMPEEPVKEGYVFSGWFAEAACEKKWDFEHDTVTSDITLFAKWEEITDEWTEESQDTDTEIYTYVVSFDMQGCGEQIESVMVGSEERLEEPDTPTAEGYEFAEWYQEAECINTWDFETDVVTKDTVLYAKWVQKSELADGADIGQSASVRIDLSAADTAAQVKSIKSRTYNGSAYTPSVTVTAKNGKKRVTLKQDTDYKLTYKNNINAGTGTVTITGIGEYAGNITAEFKITPKSVASKDVKAEDIKERVYNGSEQMPAVTVTAENGQRKLRQGADYELTYKNNINVGTGMVTITGTGNYTGSIKAKFKITPKSIVGMTANVVKEDGDKDYVYNGKAHTPLVTVIVKEGEQLKQGTDYKLTYKDNVNAGTGTVTITGTGNYKDSMVKTFSIIPISIADSDADARVNNIKEKVYDAKAYTPSVTITVNNGKKRVTLKQGRDYTLKYANNVNVGTGTVTITGIGNYTGSVPAQTFKITPKSIKKAKVVTEGMAANAKSTAVYVYDGAALLKQNTDYTLTYNLEDPKKPIVTVTAADTGNYKDSVSVKLTVYNADETKTIINSRQVNMDTGNAPYAAKSITRDVTVTVNNETLKKNKDYTVNYQNNKNLGTAFVTITGKGKYAGKVVKTFKIVQNSAWEITPVADKIYNGKEQTPSITVKAGTRKMKVNTDYTAAYSNNLHQGTATVNITGKGNYTGSRSITFTIKPQQIKKASIKVVKATDKVPAHVQLTYNKKLLTENSDYTIIKYELSGSGKYTIRVKGICDFEGEVEKKSLKIEAPDNDSELSSAISNNKGGQNYQNWGTVVTSSLFKNDDDTWTRVEYIGNKGVYAETYTSDYKLLTQKLIKLELPIFGGFYAGEKNYFLVFGQTNMEENNNTEVVRVVKYDKNWNREGAARVFGANTTTPFKFGSLRMIENEGMLYIRTCHEMYRSSDGSIHQSNMMVSVKISDMEVSSIGGGGYASHSLNQFVTIDDSYMLSVDHGDAYPRCVSLGRYVRKEGQDDFYKGSFSSIKALPILGKVGNPYTGVSVGGLKVSETAYLVAGNSVQQDDPSSYNTGGVRNIFVTSTQKDNFSSDGTTIRWITNYTENTTPVSTPHLVKVNNNEMLLMWAEGNQVKCVLLNASGEPVTEIYSCEGALSSCVPVVDGSNVIWYYTSNSAPIFCSINIEDVKNFHAASL